MLLRAPRDVKTGAGRGRAGPVVRSRAMNPGPDPLVLLAALMAGGSLVAIIARRLGLPAAAAALVLGAAVGLAGWPRDHAALESALWLPRAFAATWIGMLSGLSLDLRGWRRGGGARAMGIAMPIVFLFGAVAAWTAGFPLTLAAWAGLVMAAGSPLAAGAVCGESRARGPLAMRLQGDAALAFAGAAVIAVPSMGLMAGASLLPVALLAPALGLASGGVILLPLSRTATRDGLLAMAALGCGLILLASARIGSAPLWPVLMSLIAGAVVGSFTPAAARAREAMRDLVVPAAVVWFALEGASLGPGMLARGCLAALLLVTARGCGLLVSAEISGRARRGRGALTAVLASVPTGSWLIGLALIPSLAPPDSPAGTLVMTLLLASSLSEAVGMLAARHALAGAREAIALADDPMAWRAPMR
jgi:Kef-type K+ transport system membrane component KefB